MNFPIKIGVGQETWFNGDMEIEGFGHMFLLAKSGWGKSTMLRLIIREWMGKGFPVIVLDPHGTLIDDCLKDVPPDRIRHTIVFDPSDENFVVPFNILYGSDREKIIETVTGILSTMWADPKGGNTSWQARSDYYARNILGAVLEAQPEPTFLHFHKAVMDEKHLKWLFDRVTSANLKSFYHANKESKQDRDWQQAIAAVQNKVDALINRRSIRNVLGNYRGLEVYRDVFQKGNNLFVRVPQGSIGEDPSALFVLIFREQARAAAFNRINFPEEDWTPILFVMDEYHTHVRGQNAGKMFAETRKFKVFCVPADQDLYHMPEGAEQQVITNAETTIAGATGFTDSLRMTKELRVDRESRLQDLPDRHWIVKRGTSKGVLIKADPLENYGSPVTAQAVIDQSRRRWSKPRAQIERHVQSLINIGTSLPIEAAEAG